MSGRGAAARGRGKHVQANSASRASRLSRKESKRSLGASGTSASAIGAARIADGIWDSDSQSGRTKNSVGGGSSRGRGKRSARQGVRGSRSASSKTGSSRVQGAAAAVAGYGKLFRIVAVVLVVLLLAFGIDALVNGNKIYAGVSYGDIDLSGKTVEEATEAINAAYSDRFNNNSVVFYADEEAQNNPVSAEEESEQATLEEQMAYEDTLDSRRQWTVSATKLGAQFLPCECASQAYEVGRSDGGFLARIGALLFGNNTQAHATYNAETLSELADTITSTVGKKRIDYGIEMQEGWAVVTDGNAGDEVSVEWLESKLNEALLLQDGQSDYVVELEHLDIRITEAQAKEVALTINDAISQGICYSYEGNDINVSHDELATWITASVEGEEGSWELVPHIDASAAKQVLLSSVQGNLDTSTLEVHFQNTDGQITVSSNYEGEVPDASAAIEQTDNELFVRGERTETPRFEVSAKQIDDNTPLEDACDIGIVSEISSYTTQFSSTSDSRINNIHVAADYLTNSICAADEGTWSFNDIAGDTTEDKGYQAGGAIVAGEYSTDDIGGGICQVATTVFNAVYEAGYPVVERHNHSLYIASYPQGRDAAIAYPDMDLVWQNDTNSDVLLVMTYTNSSVTATLYGVDPGYQVSTEYGEWEEGESYSVRYETDETLEAGEEVVETTGSDGSEITIVRTVKDSEGNVLHQDAFASVYSPKTEVIKRGV